MTATDRTVSLVYFIKAEFPAGNVLLCDGGMIEYDSEAYSSYDSVFGSLQAPDAFEMAFGDMAEQATVVFAPNPDATVTDWFRSDLENCRVRAWLGELDSDGYTVSSAELMADLLVDTVERRQGAAGQDLLAVTLIGRTEKLFLIQEGNVCSERFHESVWTGENGFDNCTDLQGYVAWGTESPRRGVSGGGGFNGRGGGNTTDRKVAY